MIPSQNAHVVYSTSFQDFDPELISLQGDVYYYKNLPVYSKTPVPTTYTEDGYTFTIPQCNLLNLDDHEVLLDGRPLTSAERISLWQQVYLNRQSILDPEILAFEYRERNGICHSCFGTGHVTKFNGNDKVEEECYVCGGNGLQKEDTDLY